LGGGNRPDRQIKEAENEQPVPEPINVLGGYRAETDLESVRTEPEETVSTGAGESRRDAGIQQET